MKVKILLPLLVLFSFLIHAQSDDYCSCMETDKEQNELADLLIELTNQRPLWQTPPPNYHLNQAPPPPVQPMTIMVSEEIPEEPNDEVEKEDLSDDSIDNELDKEEAIEKSDMVVNRKRSLKVSGKTKRSKAKVKRKVKRLKGKVKKQKKMRKYKGGCPGF